VKILVVNGPNLNLLGKREPDLYGHKSFEDYFKVLQHKFSTHQLDYFQSNREGELIDKIHQTDRSDIKGIVLNAGGYSHSSVALADAVASISTPVVSVHITNIYNREEERHKELISQYVVGGIFGLGLDGYELAVQHLINP
jgi:3-dehydroquinate dehydratase-2